MVKRVFNNYPLYLIGAVSGSLSVFYLSNCMFKSSIFDFYGRNTIIILGLHVVMLSLIKGIQVFVFRIPLSVTEPYFYVNVLYCIFAFVLFVPIIRFMNRYLPFLIGRKKKPV
jgi:fucose 4-O-acetylase-like acetyltransferase